jgi:hypothetical protein
MFLLLVFAILGSQTAPRSPASAREVQRVIDTKGAHDAVSQFFADDELEAVGKGIATGAEEWLNIARELYLVSDAGASEHLVDAIQEALLNNPAGVLRLVATGNFKIADACGGYGFSQYDDDRPRSAILDLVDKRIAAVSRVGQRDLAQHRAACLTELRGLRRSLAANPPSR